jgi:hypothetical protein
MRRKRHSKKEVELALQYAENHGWRVESGGSHAWGTPRSPTNHGRQIKRIVDNCMHENVKIKRAEK